MKRRTRRKRRAGLFISITRRARGVERRVRFAGLRTRLEWELTSWWGNDEDALRARLTSRRDLSLWIEPREHRPDDWRMYLCDSDEEYVLGTMSLDRFVASGPLLDLLVYAECVNARVAAAERLQGKLFDADMDRFGWEKRR